jgi:hypothetical protein
MGNIALEEAYYLAQISAGIAVVFSLIYVGIQLKQNTRAIRLTTMESVLQQFREHEALVCQSDEVADIFWRGHQDPSGLKGPEVMRYHQLCNYYYKSFENAYFQYRDGVLDEDNWSSLKQFFIDVGNLPGMQQYWNKRKNWYSNKFQVFMDEEIISDQLRRDFKLAGTAD